MKRLNLGMLILAFLALISLIGCSGIQPTAKQGKPGLSVPFDWPQKENPEAAKDLDILENNTEKLDIY